MMFKASFHDGIASGKITSTFRYWKRPQARAGGFQMIHPIGSIEITGVSTVEPASLRDRDARRAGFPSVCEMLDYLAAFAGGGRVLYRIDFRYVGRRADDAPDRSAVVTRNELKALDEALDLRDRNGKAGPWTRRTLALVGAHPGMSSANMAKQRGREQVDLKRDMRKLKKLGLTISLETGYKLSPRGESYLAAKRE